MRHFLKNIISKQVLYCLPYSNTEEQILWAVINGRGWRYCLVIFRRFKFVPQNQVGQLMITYTWAPEYPLSSGLCRRRHLCTYTTCTHMCAYNKYTNTCIIKVNLKHIVALKGNISDFINNLIVYIYLQ